MSDRSTDPPELSDYQRCLEVLRAHENELIALPEVLGVGVGRSEEGEMGLVLLVSRLPEASEGWQASVPAELQGVPVWARLIGSIEAQ